MCDVILTNIFSLNYIEEYPSMNCIDVKLDAYYIDLKKNKDAVAKIMDSMAEWCVFWFLLDHLVA